MKKAFFILVIVFICFSNGLFSQSNEFEKPFRLLTHFEIFDGKLNEQGRQYFLALGSYNDTYLILMENIVFNDYSMNFRTYDTALVNLELEFYYSVKTDKGSYSVSDFINLRPFKYQPNSNTKGNVVAFKLPAEYAFDIKNKYLSSIKITEGGGSITIPARSNLKNYFIKNASIIKATRGSYVDIEMFNNDKLKLYSLLLNTKADIKSTLGTHTNVVLSKNHRKEYKNDSVFEFKSEYGVYEIAFKDDIAYRVIFKPAIKIQGSSGYLLEEYLNKGYPFDIYPTKETDYTFKRGFSSSGHLNYTESLDFYFKNGIEHSVRLDSKGRFITTAEAFVETDTSLLTVTKTEREKLLEKISGKQFSPIEVCELNETDYSESIFTEIRTKLKQIIPQSSFYSCTSNNYNVDFYIVIKWKHDRSGYANVKYEILNDGCEQMAKGLSGSLKHSIKNIEAPKVYGEYIDCTDTLQVNYSDFNLRFYLDEDGYKYEIKTEKEIKDFVLKNKENFGFQVGYIYEAKIVQSHFENEKYLIKMIVLSKKELSRKERKQIMGEFTF